MDEEAKHKAHETEPEKSVLQIGLGTRIPHIEGGKGTGDEQRLLADSIEDEDLKIDSREKFLYCIPKRKIVLIWRKLKANWRDLLGFWLCGLLNNFVYVLMLSAAGDMLPKDQASGK